jgi:hypothetical protein
VGRTEQEIHVSFAAIEVPPHRSLSKKLKKPILTDAELKQIVAMLHNHQTPSDGVVYTEPTKSGKQGPRTVAYMTGYAVRGEILAAEPMFTSKSLSVKTWADGDGFRWALALKR